MSTFSNSRVPELIDLITREELRTFFLYDP